MYMWITIQAIQKIINLVEIRTFLYDDFKNCFHDKHGKIYNGSVHENTSQAHFHSLSNTRDISANTNARKSKEQLCVHQHKSNYLKALRTAGSYLAGGIRVIRELGIKNIHKQKGRRGKGGTKQS